MTDDTMALGMRPQRSPDADFTWGTIGFADPPRMELDVGVKTHLMKKGAFGATRHGSDARIRFTVGYNANDKGQRAPETTLYLPVLEGVDAHQT
jgi:hypothetical protein